MNINFFISYYLLIDIMAVSYPLFLLYFKFD